MPGKPKQCSFNRAQATGRALTLHLGLVEENANHSPELEKETGTLAEDGELTPRDAKTRGMRRKAGSARFLLYECWAVISEGPKAWHHITQRMPRAS